MSLVDVTLNPPGDLSPSAQIVKAANQVFRVTDEKGREIGFKKISVLERARMLRIMGDAENQEYRVLCQVAASVVEIDGERLPVMNSLPALEARFARLEDEGMNAVMGGMAEHFATNLTEDQKEEIKNALSSPNSN